MEKQTWITVLSLCDEVEALLRDAVAMADLPRLQRIRFLTARLCGHDSYITEKANKIASRAGDYLSARKHQSRQGGADGLMQEMRYSCLAAIRDQAKRYQNGAQ